MCVYFSYRITTWQDLLSQMRLLSIHKQANDDERDAESKAVKETQKRATNCTSFSKGKTLNCRQSWSDTW